MAGVLTMVLLPVVVLSDIAMSLPDLVLLPLLLVLGAYRSWVVC